MDSGAARLVPGGEAFRKELLAPVSEQRGAALLRGRVAGENDEEKAERRAQE